MGNEKLTYYWIEDLDSQGLKFDPIKGYTLAEIDAELKAKRTNKINGKFVHFGGILKSITFHRLIVHSESDERFYRTETIFSSDTYELVENLNSISSENIIELEISEQFEQDATKGSTVLKTFGVFNANETEDNERND
jgi:hypothetical protein